jgi:FkbM family methyltransferase
LTNKEKYKKAYDIGANIGVHSIVMSLCGWDVKCIEPDPVNMGILKNNLAINNITMVKPIEAAVSDIAGEMEFVRVNGNTTSSHLAGSKQPYGDLTKFPVKVLSIKDIMKEADIIKMDVEGNEKNIILATEYDDWNGTDMMLEIGSEENAVAVFEHLQKIGVNSFSQKNGWALVKKLSDIPTSYKEGSLFISVKEKMNWV